MNRLGTLTWLGFPGYCYELMAPMVRFIQHTDSGNRVNITAASGRYQTRLIICDHA